MATISGIVKDSAGNFAKKMVRVHRRDTGAPVATVMSDATTGAYSVTTADTSEHYVVMHDAAGDPFWGQTVLACHFDAPPANGDPYMSSVVLNMRMNGANGATTFVEDSGKAIAVVGNTQISTAQSKYGGASAYFDGAGDYLTLGASSDFNLYQQDFTIECWVYLSGSGDRQIVGFNNTALDFWDLRVNGSGNIVFRVAGNGTGLTSTGTVTAGQWVHIAAVCRSLVTTIYIDGTASGTLAAGISTANGSYVLAIGANTYGGAYWNYFNGYIDDLRITKGVARYTANFTPPTAEIPATAISLVDEKGHTLTAYGSAKISTAQSKFGGASLALNGTSDYLTVTPVSSELTLDGDFTIEFFTDCQDQTTAYPSAISTQGGWNAGAFCYRFDNTGQAGKFSIHWNGATPGDPFISSSKSYSFNQWRHTALVRKNGLCMLFVEGEMVGSGNYSTTLNLAYGGTMRVGWSAWDGGNGYFKGNVDDLRITKGAARYTDSFTPPVKAFDNTALVDGGGNALIFDRVIPV